MTPHYDMTYRNIILFIQTKLITQNNCNIFNIHNANIKITRQIRENHNRFSHNTIKSIGGYNIHYVVYKTLHRQQYKSQSQYFDC